MLTRPEASCLQALLAPIGAVGTHCGECMACMKPGRSQPLTAAAQASAAQALPKAVLRLQNELKSPSGRERPWPNPVLKLTMVSLLSAGSIWVQLVRAPCPYLCRRWPAAPANPAVVARLTLPHSLAR